MSRRKFLVNCLRVTALPSAIASSQVSIPAPSFPRPKFHFGQEVIAPWEDVDGTWRDDRGIIIGMIHSPTDYEPSGWWYLLLWTYMPTHPLLIGKDDNNFQHEQKLKAFDS